MAFSATFSKSSFSYISTLLHSPARRIPFRIRVVKAEKSAEPASDQKLTETKTQEISTNSQPASSTSPPPKPKKPVYSMKKGQIVRVDKEKYLNSINIQQCNAELQKTSFGYGKADMNYLSVGHPPYYKGLDYIYEDRGEVLDIRIFETGEYALIGWVGIPTAPAWLPTDMLIKSDKLDYERM